MANTAYPLGAQKILAGSINFSSDTIKAALLPSSYTYSAAHEFVADLGTLIGTDQTLASKSIAGGVLDADNLSFGTIAPGSTIKALVIYKDTGNTSTAPVLFYFDVVTGLPMATNGGTVTIPWDNGVKKIARLGLPFYPLGAEKVLSAGINFSADTIKVALLPSSYVYDDAHEFLDDIASVIGTAQTLAGKSITGGVFDADDANFGAITTGSTIGTILLYKDTGTPSTSPLLILFTDTVGLPLATNGSGITQQWNAGAAKIFSLIPA